MAAILAVIFLANEAPAKTRPQLPKNAFDGAPRSAESLGRGLTFASPRGSPAASVENPAAMVDKIPDSLYATGNVGRSTDLPRSIANQQSALEGKFLQFVSILSDRGAIFYEPLGRVDRDVLNPRSAVSRDVEFSADAIGFAGAQAMGKNGSFGLSIAYLYGALSQVDRSSLIPLESNVDTGHGVRLNLGFRYRTGPAVWGMVLENFPGYLFWQDHRRSQLPVKIRVGNTWKVQQGVYFSLEGEKRFYREGADTANYVYSGFEYRPSDLFQLRVGAYSEDYEDPDKRRYTGGLTVAARSGISLTYGVEQFELLDEKVYESTLSLLFPFTAQDDDGD